MQYKNITAGKFILRRNRFIADVNINGTVETVHVKNTGRCKELLLPGCEVFLEKSDNPARKTLYDLVAVKKSRLGQSPLLINMDSQAPNAVAWEWLPDSGLFSRQAVFSKEVKYNNSRFDIHVCDGTHKFFIEVKGVTLEKDGVAMFPDAPTERGVKHLNELANSIRDGFEAYILFVVQMKSIHCFRPHDAIHPEFGDALRNAAKNGVNLLAVDCIITPDSMTIDNKVNIQL